MNKRYIWPLIFLVLVAIGCGPNKALYNGEVSLYFHTDGPEVVHYEEIIRERLNKLGIHNYELRILGTHEITVDVEKVEDTSLVIEMLSYNEDFQFWKTYHLSGIYKSLQLFEDQLGPIDSLNPSLFSQYIQYHFDESTQLLANHPKIGFLKKEGINMVDSLIRAGYKMKLNPTIPLFDRNLKFYWGIRPDCFLSSRKPECYELYALMSDTVTKGAFLNSDNIASSTLQNSSDKDSRLTCTLSKQGQEILKEFLEHNNGGYLAATYHDSVISVQKVDSEYSFERIEISHPSDSLLSKIHQGLKMPLYPSSPVKIVHHFTSRK